jgi:tetratricopeptide (TPR) repeat protein
LSFFFSLLALYYTIKLGETKKKKYFLFIGFFFVIALLSKQSAMVYAAICPLTLYFTEKKVDYKNILMLLIIFVVAYFSFKMFQRNLIAEGVKERFFKDNPLNFFHSFNIRSATGMMVLFFYFKILIFPHPLLFYYGYNMIPISSWDNITVILIFVIHLALFVFAVYKVKSKHPIGYGVLFYFMSISMFTNILRPAAGIVAERYAFGAALGLCIIIVSLLFSFLKIQKVEVIQKQKKYVLGCFVFLLLIPYSIKTISRNFDWKNHYTLYSADIKYLGNSAKANELYASELSRQVNEDMLKTKDFERNRAKTELAIKHFKRSIEIDSSNYTANNNLGLIYFVLYKNNAEAIKYFKNSILYKPNYGRGNFNLAIVYENQKEFDSAIFYYQIVIRVDEKNQFAYTNLANIYFNEKNNIVKAIEINKKLMGEAPDNALPYINIGTYYLKIEDTVRSLQYFEQAAEKPNIEPNFLNALSKLYARKGQNDKSQYYYRKAVRAEQKRQKVKK